MLDQPLHLRCSGLAWLLLCLLVAAPLWAQERPSVVLISIDTLRADYLPSGGAADVRTPALEQIAREGITFSRAVTVAPLTLPAHSSLMTGTYPHFHGVRDNSGYRLPEKIPTLAEGFREAGYDTAAFVGSAVLDRSLGLAEGFQHYGDRFGSQAQRRGLLAERRAEAVVDEALGWLDARRARPFFIWIHVYDPHSPYDAPGPYGSRGYKGEIEYTDSQLARVFDWLQARNRWESTLVVVVSDHGEDLNQHGEPTHGFFIYDSVLRVPWLMKLPGSEAPAGLVVEDQVSLVDVAPTIAQVVRLPLVPSSQGAGRLGQILGKPAARTDAYAETLYPSLHFGWSPLFALRTSRHKFISAPEPELYDLVEDPGETVNLAKKEQALANRFSLRLDEMRRRLQGQEPDSARLEIDPELRARLNTLGYVTSGAGSAVAVDNAPDPKQKIGVYARIYQGMEAYTEGHLDRAQRHFQAALKIDSKVPLVHDYLGSTYLAQGQLDAAIEAYREAIRLAPERLESVSNLAYAYLQAGQYEEAVAGFELVLERLPSDWQAWQLMGVAQLQSGKLDRAEAAFRQAARLSPDNRQILFNLGTVYQQEGKHLLAVEVLRGLVQLEPGDAEAWNSLASSYEASGLIEKAQEAYQKAIRANPRYALAYYNFANLFARRQDLAEAEKLYRRAIEADPAFALAYRNLAAVLELQGKQAEAETYRKKFESLSPGS